MSESGVEAIVSDYFSRLKQALAPLPRSRRDQLLDDLHEHVTMARADLADESELSVREILEHLGTPEEIAAEALAGSRRDGGRWRGRWPLGPGLAWFNEGRPVRRRAIASAAAVVVLTAGTCGVILTGDSPPPPASVKTDSAEMPLANSDCSPPTDAASSGGPAAALTSKATQVASGTVAGNHWSLWSARGHSGATGLEDGGLVINGRAYGLCPGFPNPAELEMADLGPAAIVYGVIGYPGRAKVQPVHQHRRDLRPRAAAARAFGHGRPRGVVLHRHAAPVSLRLPLPRAQLGSQAGIVPAQFRLRELRHRQARQDHRKHGRLERQRLTRGCRADSSIRPCNGGLPGQPW